MITPQIEVVTKATTDQPPIIIEGQRENVDTGGFVKTTGTTSVENKGDYVYKTFIYCKPTEFVGTTDHVVAIT